MKKLIAVLIILLLGLAFAQNTGSFRYSYEDSNNELFREYAQILSQRQFFESISQNLNKAIALPYDIGLVAVQCDTINAFWSPDNKAIVVCYEMLDILVDAFRRDINDQQELSNAVFGALEFIFYHELGHALIDIFEIPSTGREEDAVDQFSTLFLLDTDVGISAALSGASFFYTIGEASGGSVQDLAFWDEHSLNQQRFYNIVCLVFGSNPNQYQNLVMQNSKGFLPGNGRGILPKERAVRCPSEYKDISRSWNILINDYVAFKNSPNTNQAGNAPVAQPVATPVVNPPVNNPVSNPSTGQNYESYSGTLSSTDTVLDNGEYIDVYELELNAGQEVNIALESNDFDTYLIVQSPEETSFENDDAVETNAQYSSNITIPVIVTGTYKVGVTSYEAATQGSYSLVISKQDAVYDGLAEEQLQTGDAQFDSGEFYDVYDYDFEAGEHITLALSSSQFDPYLLVVSPSGQRQENDDYAGQSHLSRLDFDVAETGTWKVYVSSYEQGESGAYQLVVGHHQAGQPVAAPVAQPAAPQASTAAAATVYNGSLQVGDSTLNTGEYADLYNINLSVGQQVVLNLSSNSFNTYLGIQSPSGVVTELDELANQPFQSRISIVANEAGTWTVFVTSMQVGEQGNYSLSIQK